MSRETLRHLNTNTLIGNTDARGTAWHYRAEDQGAESNHYAGPIPVGDVERRLFIWLHESRTLSEWCRRGITCGSSTGPGRDGRSRRE